MDPNLPRRGPLPSRRGPCGGHGATAAGLRVAVLGAGPFAQGFCSRAINTGAIHGSHFSLGVRGLAASLSDDPFEQISSQGARLSSLPGVAVKTVPAAILDADVVLLAVPARNLARLLKDHGAQLKGKVILDVSNPAPGDLAALLGRASHGASSTAAEAATKDVESSVSMSGDTCQPGSVAAYLQAALGSDTPVVKACNNLSAYTLGHADTYADTLQTAVATDAPEAGQLVGDLLQSMGIQVTQVPSLLHAPAMERRHTGLMREWQLPLAVTVVTWLVCHVYTFIRYNYFGGSPWESITMWIANKSIGWAALWTMVLTYCPGVMVCWAQLVMRRPTLRLWGWVKTWMDMRKQLGLLALFGVLLHLLLSTFLWMPSYYSKLWQVDTAGMVPLLTGASLDNYGLMKPGVLATCPPSNVTLLPNTQGVQYNMASLSTAPTCGAAHQNASKAVLAMVGTHFISLRSRLNWIGELSMFLGIAAGVAMGLTGLTSVPCITPRMNWREWRFMQSVLGWSSLVLSTVHVILLGAPAWPRWRTEWPALIPTITLVSVLPAMMLLVLKGTLILPPCSLLLARVRSGRWPGRPSGVVALNQIPDYAACYHG